MQPACEKVRAQWITTELWYTSTNQICTRSHSLLDSFQSHSIKENRPMNEASIVYLMM